MIRPKLIVLAALVVLAPLGATAGTGADEGFFIARFGSHITDASRAALTSTGLEVIDYEPQDSYIVWGSAHQVAHARTLPAVSSVHPMPVTRKVDPGVLDDVLVEVTMRGSPAEAIIGRVRSLRAARPGTALSTARVQVAPGMVQQIARRADVLHIGPAGPGGVEDEASAQILAGNISEARVPVPGYKAWLQGKGLDGDGIRVAIVDTGITPHHPDFADRIVESYTYGSTTDRCASECEFLRELDTGGHGSHVAGIVAGAPPATTDMKDTDGFSLGTGVAPKALLVRQNAVAEGVEFPPYDGLQVLSADSWSAGARIWNASWHTGGGNRIGYTAHVRTVDKMARDADFDAPGSEEFLLVFSAGNSGAAGPTEPKEAKNIIAVGSVHSGRGLRGGFIPTEAVSSFSSRGPTKDGRIFPTIVAPGDSIMSARAPESTLACIPAATGAGLYYMCDGTSMAAPHVAGAAALLHQWWRRETGSLPSPVLSKALFVNTAQDMGSKNIPNSNEGWGRVNLNALFSAVPGLVEDQTTVLGEPGEQAVRTVEVTDATRPLKVTLAWADAPAAEGAELALVNDLDLVVERLDGLGAVVQTWLGNSFSRGASVEDGTADRKNNLENVYVVAPEPGTYRITVRAENVPGDGIPHNTDETDQDFVLIART